MQKSWKKLIESMSKKKVGLLFGVLVLGTMNVSGAMASLFSPAECRSFLVSGVDESGYSELCRDSDYYDLCQPIVEFAYDRQIYWLAEDEITRFYDYEGYNISDVCELCQPGYFFDESLGGCAACGVGTYMPTANLYPECYACDAGYNTNLTGQSTCVYTDGNGGSGTPATCPAGMYLDGTVCKNCRPGTYKTNNGITDCLDCEDGYYSDSYGATICTPCPEPEWENAAGYWEYANVGGTISSSIGGEYDNPHDGEYHDRDSIMSCYLGYDPGNLDWSIATDDKGEFVLTDKCWYNEN